MCSPSVGLKRAWTREGNSDMPLALPGSTSWLCRRSGRRGELPLPASSPALGDFLVSPT